MKFEPQKNKENVFLPSVGRERGQVRRLHRLRSRDLQLAVHVPQMGIRRPAGTHPLVLCHPQHILLGIFRHQHFKAKVPATHSIAGLVHQVKYNLLKTDWPNGTFHQK